MTMMESGWRFDLVDGTRTREHYLAWENIEKRVS
jgi:hypothetical protein